MTPRTLALLAAVVTLAFFAGCEHRRADREAETRKQFEARAIDAERFNRRMDALRRTDSMAAAHAHREATRLRDSLRYARAEVVLMDAKWDALLDSLDKPDGTQREKLLLGLAAHYRAVADTALSLLALSDRIVDTLEYALDRERAAHRWTLMARDSLAATLAARPKPGGGSFWAKLIPDPYVGYGVTGSGGQVYAGWQVGAGWKFALPNF